MRSPADMDILVADATNRCFLNCSNCTRLVSHQTKTRELAPDQFRRSLRNLAGWWRPGKVVGLIGGEPTLHSEFSELCRVFREEWNPGADPAHGREPIADFNVFAEQRLWDRSNGRGLWTSFGPRFVDHYEAVMDTFSHWNPNDHTAGGTHQTGLVDAKEMCAALGIPWEDWPKYRDNCWVQNSWSASITPKGTYFCEYAGQLDLLYNDGRRAWKDEPGWWKRTPAEFGDQLELCEMCSLCLPGPGQVDSKDRDIVGKAHRVRLEQVGSPAVKGDRFEAFDPAVHVEHRAVTTKDSYTAGARVAADNRSMFPKKLSLVTVCVGRAGHLRQTLAHNADLVDEIVVVTTPEDWQTEQAIATDGIVWGVRHPDRGQFRVIPSSRCFDNDMAFNKGALLNDGLAALAPGGDWVVLADADVFLNPHLREYVRTHALNPGVLYGTVRVDLPPAGAPVAGPPDVNAEPNGYFQLFNRRAAAVRGTWPAVMSEAFCSAGGIDSWFMARFPPGKRCVIPELAVGHIPHGPHGAGWNGTADGPRWRQGGVLTRRAGVAWLVQPPEQPRRFRLTDTKNGRSIVCQVGDDLAFPDSVVTSSEHGLVFGGEPIGDHHVHVAYWG